MTLIVEDLQQFSRDTEEYVHTVIALTALNQCALETAALRVVGRLAAVLDAMFEGISAADAAHALGPPQSDSASLGPLQN